MKINWFNKLLSAAEKNAPGILGGLAVAGLIAAVASAIYDTPKAMQVYEEEKQARIELGEEPMTKFEVFKLCVPCYIPTIATTVATGICMITSVVTGQKRYAALASVCGLTEASFRNFKESAKEVLSDEQFEAVRDRAADKTIENHHTMVQNGIIPESDITITGKGNMLCIEAWSGKPFRASREHVEHCINVINERMMQENWVTLSDLLDEIGVYTYGKNCRYMGWDINRDGLILLSPSSRLYEGEPALVVDYMNPPVSLPELR